MACMATDGEAMELVHRQSPRLSTAKKAISRFGGI